MRYAAVDTAKQISRIGLGTWQFGSREWGYGPGYEADAAAIVRRALDLGVTLFDTAEVYGFGRSERILGAALGADRDKVVLATKLFPLLPIPAVVEQRAIASAARLGTRTIDLYQVHQPNPFVRDSRTMRGMRILREVGLVGDAGVSNYSLARWRAAEAALGAPVLSNQVRYSIIYRAPEADLIPYAEANGRLIIAYSPLAQGFVSGRYGPDNPPTGTVRRANPLFSAENFQRAAGLLDTLREVAAAHDATPSQIALAYVLRNPAVVAIPGASSVAQVEHNVAAAEIDLAEDEYAVLAGAARRFQPVTGLAAMARSRLRR